MNRVASRIGPRSLSGALATVLFVSSGCGGNRPADYVPRSDVARQAVETALKSWKSGAAYGPVTTTKPAINVFEARWQAGRKLESYEIAEEVSGQAHPQFKVRLKLGGQPEETETYRVIGIDPLNVFREADYRRATGM